jgi:hypothetical protein
MIKNLLTPLTILLFSFNTLAQEKVTKVELTFYRVEFSERGSRTTKTNPDKSVQVETDGEFFGPVFQVTTGAAFKTRLDNEIELDVYIPFPTFGGVYAWGTTIESVDFSISLPKGVHKYFWYRKNAIQIEAPASQMQFSPYLINTVRRGNEHDLSKSVNGHMPTKLIKKDTFKENDIWIHDSSWGKEAYRVIDLPAMLPSFDRINEVLAYVNAHFQRANEMQDLEILEKVNNEKILNHLKEVANWVLQFEIEKSPIHQAAISIEKEFAEESKEDRPKKD